MGFVYVVVAYLIWGLVPVYWKALPTVSPVELIGHRVIWTFALSLVLIRWRGRGREFFSVWRQPPRLALHLLAALLIAANWLSFVWAVLNDRILDTSLGYFMAPLASVLMAMIFLGERLRALQWLAIGLAAAGVSFTVWQLGQIPTPALVVMFSWSGYSFIKKWTSLGSISSLAVETAVLAPFVLGWMAWRASEGLLAWDIGWTDGSRNLWLMSTGVVTIIPLLLYSEAAKTLPLSTLGMFQYSVPSLTFLLAVWVYGETFTWVQMTTFVAIWGALCLYGIDQAWHRREIKRETRSQERGGRPPPTAIC